MNETFQAGMQEATRLTREGRLAEATALLQRLLQGGTAPPAEPTPPPSPRHPAAPPARVTDIDPETGAPVDAPSAPTGRIAGDAAPTPPSADAGAAAWNGLPDLLRRLVAGQGAAGAAEGWPGLADAARGLPGFADLAALRPGAADAQPLRPRGKPTRPRRARPAPPAEPLPEGARFLAETFAASAGSRDYRLYVPASLNGRPAPLLVMLHGCTQSPEDFAAGTRMNALAEQHGCLVAWPAQPPSANPQKCWNWFRPEDQARDRGEPAILAGLTRRIVDLHGADPGRVFVAGLSAGGAAAAVLGAAYPDLFAAVGVHSGLPSGAARDVGSALAAMKQGAALPPAGAAAADRLVPTIVFHADNDATVHPRNGDLVLAQAMARGAAPLRVETQHGQVPEGRAWRRTLHRDASGRPRVEHWLVQGGGHAWSGGSTRGSFTDPRGPDASRAMLDFFLAQAPG